MVRYNLYLQNHQDRELKKLGGMKSEHIRRALDMYLELMRTKEPTSVTSPSNAKPVVVPSEG